MFRRILKASAMAVLAIAVGVGVAYAIDYTGGYFLANGTIANNLDNTEMSKNKIHFTDAVDVIDLAGSNDIMYMGQGADELNMGPGSDSLDFYGDANTTETLTFNTTDNSYIKWTGSNDSIDIRSNAGDVIITLGQ